MGYIPYTSDINLEGLDIDEKTVSGLLEIDRELWQKEASEIREYYGKFGGKVPKELLESLEKLENSIK